MTRDQQIYVIATKIATEVATSCDCMEKNAETCKLCKKVIQKYCNQLIEILATKPLKRRIQMPKKLSNAVKLKSKTINVNIAAAAIVKIVESCGVEIPVDLVLAIFPLLNIAMRMVTKKPLDEK